MRCLVLFLFLFLLLISASTGLSATTLQDGDIIFQVSRSAQSLAIQRASGSKYSHMGLIVFQGKSPYVFEAVKTVRLTPLANWIARGEDKHYVVKRLHDAETQLTPASLKKLRAAAQKYAGRPYDLTFEWSDRRMYCSELVWKAYDQALGIQIGTMQKLGDFNLDDPIVRAKIQERYGNKIPLEEWVISPAATFESALLRVVVEY
jgi:uncharacterized protein YycO